MPTYLKIKAIEDTYLKEKSCKVGDRILSSTDPNFKGSRQSIGKVWPVESLGERIAGHQLVRLAYGSGERYIFTKHWQVIGKSDSTTEIKELQEIPPQAIAIIKKWEERTIKEVYHAYPDPAHGWRVPTIGFGTTVYPNGERVRRGDSCTLEQAIEYLAYWIENRILPSLRKIPTWDRMNDNQRSAIISFAYNLGANFYNSNGFSSITAVCNSPSKWNQDDWITQQFVKYHKAYKPNGQPDTRVEEGLKNRRKDEAALFCKPPKVIDINTKIPPEPKPVNHNTAINFTLLNNPDAVKRQLDRLNKYVLPGKKLDLNTKVYYAPQRDNPSQQHRTCNTSSNAMYTDFLLRATGRPGLGLQQDGDLNDNGYFNKMLRVGDSTSHGVQTSVVKQYGFNTKWMTDRDWPFILDLLKVGIPVVINIFHRSSLNNIKAGRVSMAREGHVICLIGINPSHSSSLDFVKYVVVHDPYGTVSSGYRNHNGAYDQIPLSEIMIRHQGGYRILA